MSWAFVYFPSSVNHRTTLRDTIHIIQCTTYRLRWWNQINLYVRTRCGIYGWCCWEALVFGVSAIKSRPPPETHSPYHLFAAVPDSIDAFYIMLYYILLYLSVLVFFDKYTSLLRIMPTNCDQVAVLLIGIKWIKIDHKWRGGPHARFQFAIL